MRLGDFHALDDLHPLLDALVVGLDEASALAHTELADQGGVRALQNADDLAFGAAVGLDTGDARDDAITVHGRFGGRARDEQVAANGLHRRVGDDERVPLTMHGKAADGVLGAEPRNDVVPGPRLDELAAICEPVERGLEFTAILTADLQFAEQLFEIGAGVGQVADVLHQRGIAEHVSHSDTRAAAMIFTFFRGRSLAISRRRAQLEQPLSWDAGAQHAVVEPCQSSLAEEEFYAIEVAALCNVSRYDFQQDSEGLVVRPREE